MKKEESAPRTGTLTVYGSGEVEVRPDMAKLDLGVSTRGKTAQEATGLNAERMNAVIAAIKGLGIRDEDIQTSGLSVYPIIEYQEGPSYGQIIGYGADNQVTVRTDIELTGEVFDAAIAAGANQSSSLSFQLKDEGPARDRALEAAFKAARRQAQVAASAAGAQIQGPRSIEVSRATNRVFFTRAAEKTRDAATPVQPGLLTINAEVTIVFDYLYS
jgi:hypothetical protein